MDTVIGARALERFRRFVDVRAPDECWPWTAAVGSKGYGSFELKVKGRWRGVGAHRVALAEALGRELAPGEQALHSLRCWTRLCCNPSHLRPGSHAENMRDKAAARSVAGERHPNSVLTDDQRRAILADPRGHAAVARELGVTRQAVFYVRKNWRAA